MYTKSIAFAPDGSEELALAYGNRSAVNLREGKLIECLLDINRALEGNCPARKRERMMRRKEDLLEQMRANERYANYNGNETDPIDATNADEDADFRSRCNFGNALIPNASSKIRIEYDDGRWGSHIVATEDIEPGKYIDICSYIPISKLFLSSHIFALAHKRKERVRERQIDRERERE